jgi:hypothetical protein
MKDPQTTYLGTLVLSILAAAFVAAPLLTLDPSGIERARRGLSIPQNAALLSQHPGNR